MSSVAVSKWCNNTRTPPNLLVKERISSHQNTSKFAKENTSQSATNLLNLKMLRSTVRSPLAKMPQHLYGPYSFRPLAVNFQKSHFSSNNNAPLSFFQQSQLPANTIVRFVPQQTAWVVERMGKFHRILEPGLAILFPFLDKIQYVQSLKEAAIEIPTQSAITSDNVTLEMDGVLYIKVVDAYKASYGVEDAEYAISQLAQTTMRSEIGQLTLDHVLKERQSLNHNITTALNEAANDWGLTCLRYEIKDIHPPQNVLEAMHRQVSAERSKRAEILDSEGHRQAAINIAEGEKQSKILSSEAQKAQSINEADGEAQAILAKAKATALGIEQIAKAINETPGGKDAVGLQVAEHYVEAFGKLAKESNTVIVPAGLNDMGSFISSGLGIYNQVSQSLSSNKAVSNAINGSIKPIEPEK